MIKRGGLVFAVLASMFLFTVFVSAFSFSDLFGNNEITGNAVNTAENCVYSGGVLAYTSFEDGVNDQDREYLKGQLVGNAVISSQGKIGNGVSFDGDGDAVSYGNALSSGRSQLSVSMWVKVNDLTKDSAFLTKGQFGSGNAIMLWRDDIVYGTSKGDLVSFLVNDGSHNVRVETEVGSWNDNDWHHVVATFVGNQEDGMRIYLDGELATDPVSTVNVDKIAENDNILRLGSSEGLPVEKSLDGSIDEFSAWAITLNSTQVKELYNSGLGREVCTSSSSSGGSGGSSGECSIISYQLDPSELSFESDELPTNVIVNLKSTDACNGSLVNFGISSNDPYQEYDIGSYDLEIISFPGSQSYVGFSGNLSLPGVSDFLGYQSANTTFTVRINNNVSTEVSIPLNVDFGAQQCSELREIAKTGSEGFVGAYSGISYPSARSDNFTDSAGRVTSYTSWYVPNIHNDPGYFVSLTYKEDHLSVALNIEEDLKNNPKCTTINEYESEKYGVLYVCAEGFSTDREEYLKYPSNVENTGIRYIGLKGTDVYELRIGTSEVLDDADYSLNVLQAVAKQLSDIEDNKFNYRDTTLDKYYGSLQRIRVIKNDFFDHLLGNESCFSDFEPILYSTGNYYEGEYCQPNWACKTEPAICPEYGIQKEVCVENSCSQGDLVYKSSRICDPGICSGCLVPRWIDAQAGDNTCIPYGFRLDHQVKVVWEEETETDDGILSVSDAIAQGDEVNVTISPEGKVILYVPEWNEEAYVLYEGDSVDLSDTDYYYGAETDVEITFTVEDVVYNSQNYEESYIVYNFEIYMPGGERIDRINGYCDLSGNIYPQKTEGFDGSWASCQNNYECESNLCSGGECVEINDAIKQAGEFKSVFIRAICRIGNLFNNDDYDQCVVEYLGY